MKRFSHGGKWDRYKAINILLKYYSYYVCGDPYAGILTLFLHLNVFIFQINKYKKICTSSNLFLSQ